MKIYCDFCGAQIETSVDKTCPNCGGYYSHDKELLNERERVKRLNEIEEERRRLEAERMRLENQNMADMQNLRKRMSPGCLGMLVAMAIMGVFFVLMIICIFLEEAENSGAGTAAADAKPRVSYTISMEPIDVPEIPEIVLPDIEIPEISVTKAEIPKISV